VALCPILCDMSAVRRDGVLMAAASVIFLVLCWLGLLGIVHGAVLVVLLIAYLWHMYHSLPPGEECKAAAATEKMKHHMPRGGGLSPAFIAIGAVALVAGAAHIARAFGLPNTVIRITLVAVGTSLPEFVPTVVAALCRRAGRRTGVFNKLGRRMGKQGCVLITGAARRIGRALAVDLGSHGWQVAVHYHNSEADAVAVVAAITDAGGAAEAVYADLADTTAPAALVAQACDKLGPLTALINNASIFERDDLATVTAQSWDDHMGVNLRAPLLLSQAFAAQLPTGCGGNVVNMIDQRVWKLNPFFMSYTTSKVALWTLTQTLAMALAPQVRVNAVGPGAVLPNERQSEAQFEALWHSTPLQRRPSPDDVCQAVRYLLQSDAVTGQMIAIDSGQHLPWPPPDPDIASRD